MLPASLPAQPRPCQDKPVTWPCQLVPFRRYGKPVAVGPRFHVERPDTIGREIRIAVEESLQAIAIPLVGIGMVTHPRPLLTSPWERFCTRFCIRLSANRRKSSTPGRIRTCNPRFRSATMLCGYPTVDLQTLENKAILNLLPRARSRLFLKTGYTFGMCTHLYRGFNCTLNRAPLPKAVSPD